MKFLFALGQPGSAWLTRVPAWLVEWKPCWFPDRQSHSEPAWPVPCVSGRGRAPPIAKAPRHGCRAPCAARTRVSASGRSVVVLVLDRLFRSILGVGFDNSGTRQNLSRVHGFWENTLTIPRARMIVRVDCCPWRSAAGFEGEGGSGSNLSLQKPQVWPHPERQTRALAFVYF